MTAAPRRIMSRDRACPMPPAAPVITATCPVIVCILTAPPDGASRVPTLPVSRPGSSMVPGIMEFMNPYYRPFLLLHYFFFAIALEFFDRKRCRPKIEEFQASTAG